MTPREAIALLDHPALRAFTAGVNPTHGGNPTVIDPAGSVPATPFSPAPQHWADL